MPTIINPTPITGTFSGMWISHLSVIFPAAGKKGLLTARLLPYNGTHLLATGAKEVRLLDLTDTKTPALTALLSTLNDELSRLSGETGLAMVQVIAPDPAKPVMAQAFFAQGEAPFRILDCFGQAAEDAAFAAALNTIMGAVASLAGATVTD